MRKLLSNTSFRSLVLFLVLCAALLVSLHARSDFPPPDVKVLHQFSGCIAGKPFAVHGARAQSGEDSRENAIIGYMNDQKNNLWIKKIDTDSTSSTYGEVITDRIRLSTKRYINSFSLSETMSDNPSDELPAIVVWSQRDTWEDWFTEVVDPECETCEIRLAKVFAGPTSDPSTYYHIPMDRTYLGREVASSTGYTDCADGGSCDDVVFIVYSALYAEAPEPGEDASWRLRYNYYDKSTDTYTDLSMGTGHIPCPAHHCSGYDPQIKKQTQPAVAYNPIANKWLVAFNQSYYDVTTPDGGTLGFYLCTFGQFINYVPGSPPSFIREPAFEIECRVDYNTYWDQPQVASNPSGPDPDDQGFLVWMDLSYRLLNNEGSCLAFFSSYIYRNDVTTDFINTEVNAKGSIANNTVNNASRYSEGHFFSGYYNIATGIRTDIGTTPFNTAYAVMGGDPDMIPGWCKGTGAGEGLCEDDSYAYVYCDGDFIDQTSLIEIDEPSSPTIDGWNAVDFVDTDGELIMLILANPWLIHPSDGAILYNSLPTEEW